LTLVSWLEISSVRSQKENLAEREDGVRDTRARPEVLDRLTSNPVCGYHTGGPPATEPTALAAMALIGDDRWEQAEKSLDWLTSLQAEQGGVGVDAGHSRPRWPTGWVALAWQFAVRRLAAAGPVDVEHHVVSTTTERWSKASYRAVQWLQSLYGCPGNKSDMVGHNTRLRGWPWVEMTHSWVEPTAISVLALKAAGLAATPRVREAVQLLLDRMLPDGGWNQGNTVVLGNTLRPHIQPTGLVLAALHGEDQAGCYVEKSIAYLQEAVSARTATASLCYAVLGAAVHGTRLKGTQEYLTAATRRTLQRDGSPYKLALLCLAGRCGVWPWLGQ
jgi:hypothetical protein